MQYVHAGTPLFRRINLALFLGGFVTFATLYCTQPLMPVFTHQFHVTPVEASLSLSVCTGLLSFFVLVAGSLSEAWGRKPVMLAALWSTAVLTLVAAWSPGFRLLLGVRAVQGIALAGLPSIAMAYLSEEVAPHSLGVAMGIYIGGNSIGGLSGRVIVGAVTDLVSWRWALTTIGALALVSSVCFWRLLPPSANFHPRPLEPRQLARTLGRHMCDPALLCLFGVGFLLMGSFVTLYNYIGYLLTGPPYRLSQTAIGSVFFLYLVGAFSSAWMGRLADRHGRRKVLWLGILIMLCGAPITLAPALAWKIAGVGVYTFGFFGGHSIASSWVGRRALEDRAQASSLYLFFYYMGSSVAGTAGGVFWSHFGWPGVVGMIAGFLLLAFLLSLRLTTIPALPQAAR